MSSPSVGALIWTAMVPLLKIALVTLAGFTLTRAGLFPLAASRGFSQVTMNLALPALVFASIVPSFNASNSSSIGPLLLTALFYEAIGLVLAFIIREVFYVPRDFQWGILIMGALSNWGNLPTAIVTSVASNSPFDPSTDPALGTAYVACFILAYNLTFFTGLYKVCAWDFMHDAEEEQAPELFLAKWARRRRWLNAKLGRKSSAAAGGKGLEEADANVASPAEKTSGMGGAEIPGASVLLSNNTNGEDKLASSKSNTSCTDESEAGPIAPLPSGPIKSRRISSGQQQLAKMDRLTRQTSAATVDSVLDRSITELPPVPSATTITRRVLRSFHHNKDRLPPPPPSNVPSRAPSPTHDHPHPSDPSSSASSSDHPPSPPQTAISTLKTVLLSLLTPITCTLIVSIIIALVPPLKALFVPNVEGWSGTRIHLAPDGRPPLAFIQDTASFVGAMCVPGSTILLGASFARIEIPKPFSKLPIASILAMTAVKMIILPVIGVFFVTNLTGFFPKEDKILSFTAILLSSTPAAVNQLVLVQLVAPGGRADTIAAFLLVQYLFMFISTTAVTAIGLHLVS